MSGSVSGSQFQFVPRIAQGGSATESPDSWSGEGGREFKGVRSVAPIAKGAFSSQDRALSMRAPEDSLLSHGKKTVGSWLFKMED